MLISLLSKWWDPGWSRKMTDDDPVCNCGGFTFFRIWTYLRMSLVSLTKIDLISCTFCMTWAFRGRWMVYRTRYDLISLTFLMVHTQVIVEDIALLSRKSQALQSLLKL